MNVGYFTHTNIGPSETFVRELAEGLYQKDRINITFISGSIDQVNINSDIPAISTGYSEISKVRSELLYKAGQVFGGRGYLWKNDFEKKTAESRLKKSNIPSFDVAYVEYATSGVLLMDYLTGNKIPFVVHVHGYDVTAAKIDPIYASRLTKLYRQAAKIITPSEHIKRVIVLDGCDPGKVKVLYPFQVPGNLQPSQWQYRYSNKPTVTFIGRLTQKKNPIALLYAFSMVLQSHPDVTLNMLGDGELMQKCKSTAAKLDIDQRVRFYGVVTREQAFEVLLSTWVYAQHSVTSVIGDQEGFPISLAEAAAHGIPLVSTIHSGITENIIDGKTGYLVQEHNYVEMAKKISALIKNPRLAETMGKAARKRIKKICSPGHRVEKIGTYLQNVAEKKQ